MNNKLRSGPLAIAMIMMIFSHRGSAPINSGMPVNNQEECSRISLPAVEGESRIPFQFCTDTGGATDEGALDSSCSKTYESNCSKGKCQEQGRGKCLAMHDSEKSVGVRIVFDAGTCRRDPDVCKDSKKDLFCKGEIRIPARARLKCKCDCTLPGAELDGNPDLRNPEVRSIARQLWGSLNKTDR
jgi:hypothetical protein